MVDLFFAIQLHECVCFIGASSFFWGGSPFGVSLSEFAMPNCAERRRCHWCRQLSLCHFWDLEGSNVQEPYLWYCDPCWLWYEIEEMTNYYMQELVEEMPQCTVIATEVFAQRHLMRSICSFLAQFMICHCQDCINDLLFLDQPE